MIFSENWKKFKANVRLSFAKLTRAQREHSELIAQCQHEEREKKSKYTSGDYYDTAQTEEWLECVICGHKIDKKTTRHNHYG